MVTKISTFLSLISFFLLLSSSSPLSVRDSLRQCIYEKVKPIPVDRVLHFPSVPSYEPILETNIQNVRFLTQSYGERMSEIAEDQTPLPFRNGTLYGIEYMMAWNETDTETARENINWVRSLYEYMTPYVSKNPRGAYSNLRDYELGTNYDSEPTDKWGFNYFKSNFNRLKTVKRSVDPENYFASEQSIPPARIIQRRKKGRKFSPATAAV